jgi:hypothetical protein
MIKRKLSALLLGTRYKIKFPGTMKQYGPSKDSIAFNLRVFPVISAFRRQQDTPAPTEPPGIIASPF